VDLQIDTTVALKRLYVFTVRHDTATHKTNIDTGYDLGSLIDSIYTCVREVRVSNHRYLDIRT
jgi:hypothetical protein